MNESTRKCRQNECEFYVMHLNKEMADDTVQVAYIQGTFISKWFSIQLKIVVQFYSQVSRHKNNKESKQKMAKFNWKQRKIVTENKNNDSYLNEISEMSFVDNRSLFYCFCLFSSLFMSSACQ